MVRIDRPVWDLTTKRGRDPETGRQPKHIDSRHRDDGADLVHPGGEEFGRGTRFPSHMNASHINEVKEAVQSAWVNHRSGRPSRVRGEQYVPGGENGESAYRVSVKIKKFGLRMVGAFIRRGEVATVFPEESSGSSKLKTKHGETVNKAKW